MRTHVILPEDLVKAVDKESGKGKRSKFIEEAVREKLRIDALRAALEATAGALKPGKLCSGRRWPGRRASRFFQSAGRSSSKCLWG